ncbi:CD225/dispanin family protein [Akkermansiaceae bacterium]|nr:CD225/dispanin family protein [Akkermansiaceae bacterium]
MSWYYSKNGTQLGPLTDEELKAKASSGEVLATDLVWKEGMADWKAYGQVPELHPGGISPQVPALGQMGSVPMQQPAAYPAGYAPQIPNYLWQSIVATVLCCMPFGVVAIVYAAKVDGLVARGDIAGANAASKSAKTWMSVAVGCGLFVLVAYVLLIIIGAASGSLN